MTSESIQTRNGRRQNLITAVQVCVRGGATAAALLAAYYLLPARAKSQAQEVLWLVAALAAFVAVIALQVRAIVTSRHPQLRAIESLVVAIPLFLIVFARIYLTVSSASPDSFSLDLDPTRALYFTITVFSTVGFGDISPQTDFTRLMVSGQMLLDLVVLGALVRVLLAAVERSGRSTDTNHSNDHGD